MANTIADVYVTGFEAAVRQLAQQGESKLRPHVMERGSSASKETWGRVGSKEMAAKASRGAATPERETPWSDRVSLTGTYSDGDIVGKEDIVQVLMNPNSEIAESLAMSARRQYDRTIIAAATASALDGQGGSNAFPAAQKVGDGTSPISFAMVTKVQNKFMSNDIAPDVPKVFVVGPNQVERLMQLTEQTSTDFVRGKLDQLSSTGITPNWMGFTWICSNLLTAPAGNQLSCLAFTKRALGLQVNQDISAFAAQSPSQSFDWQLYIEMTIGAVRVEDEQIVHVHVDDTELALP